MKAPFRALRKEAFRLRSHKVNDISETCNARCSFFAPQLLPAQSLTPPALSPTARGGGEAFVTEQQCIK